MDEQKTDDQDQPLNLADGTDAACRLCLYYQPVPDPEGRVGECRFSSPPPFTVALETAPEKPAQRGTLWPLVYAGDWCGDYHPGIEPGRVAELKRRLRMAAGLAEENGGEKVSNNPTVSPTVEPILVAIQRGSNSN